ncbi:GNAT family N-acetyltransferase [Streptacidiphilus fuscans]|uniref:N-acetyltransferase domain-containing protein n=1 Tax=Streptacidiphilus fuscans TaxID=2789292 RepID=A0A931B2L2_9ACTN|nr:hypothetical protein [Streptacidiphilus fuscans]MBF9066848.1 hypothetical protein [Streptacidiphilus fuscans]
MLSDIARRAEDLITSKLSLDAATPAARQSLDAETACWGRTVALRVPALRELPFYNKARGFNEDDLPYLDAIFAFFTEAGIEPTLEVWAGDAGDRLGAALALRGLYAGTVTATLHRHLDSDSRPPVVAHDSVTVDELDPSDDTDYLTTLLGGYELTSAPSERRTMLRAEHDPTTVRRYLARVNGHPAAAASLYVTPTGALLSGAATLPQYRRHGCQSALITHRLADAAKVTDLAVVTVAYGSPSQLNLERAGFRITHTRTTWRPIRYKSIADAAS